MKIVSDFEITGWDAVASGEDGEGPLPPSGRGVATSGERGCSCSSLLSGT